MSALKLFGLIGALMISAALVCSGAMLVSGLLSTTGASTVSDAATFASETILLLALVIWLRSILRPTKSRDR